MNYNVFSLIHYENNKLIYKQEKYDLKYILDNIKETISLVLDENIFSYDYFVDKKKYFRYFKNEKYNLEKTSYVCWQDNYKLQCSLINNIISNLLSNLSSETKYIKLNDNFNEIIDMIINTNITHIIFGNKFNRSIDNLSWIIEYLHFGEEFNQSLNNLPGSVKKLIFSTNSNFNQQLDCLPNCLQYLLLPINYKCQIDNLPNSLKYLELYSKYPNSLNNLPKSLEKFIFYYSGELENNIKYTNYKYIKSSGFQIPFVPCYYDEKKNNNIYHIEKIFVRLPKDLKYLDLTYSYKLNFLSDYINYNMNDKNSHIKNEMIKNSQIFDNLPSNLEVLKYPSNYNLILVEQIPQNIIKLFLSNKFNKSIDKLLNPNFGTSKLRPKTKITHLIFGNEFNQSVNYLPTTITHIFFGSSFNKSIDNLPNSIEVLVLGTSFNIEINNFPINLKEITFGEEFNQLINGLKLQVQKIKFTKYNYFTTLSEKKYSKENFFHEFKYNKKITKIPPNAKLLLPNLKSNEEFYYMFNEYIEKCAVEYY